MHQRALLFDSCNWPKEEQQLKSKRQWHWSVGLPTIECADGGIVVTRDRWWRLGNITFVFLDATDAANHLCAYNWVTCPHRADGMKTHTVPALQHHRQHPTHHKDIGYHAGTTEYQIKNASAWHLTVQKNLVLICFWNFWCLMCTKFGHLIELILRQIVKIVATRC